MRGRETRTACAEAVGRLYRTRLGLALALALVLDLTPILACRVHSSRCIPFLLGQPERERIEKDHASFRRSKIDSRLGQQRLCGWASGDCAGSLQPFHLQRNRPPSFPSSPVRRLATTTSEPRQLRSGRRMAAILSQLWGPVDPSAQTKRSQTKELECRLCQLDPGDCPATTRPPGQGRSEERPAASGVAKGSGSPRFGEGPPRSSEGRP
jgi:hypothetical protein